MLIVPVNVNVPENVAGDSISALCSKDEIIQLAEYTASPDTVVPKTAVTVFLAKKASVNVIMLVESSYLIRPSKLISPDITPGINSENPDESFEVASGVSADKLSEHDVV